ncbi:hypothetical protein ACTXGL_01610 [Psychrobacter sp. T6-6]|uniref:hypothetical protein n=1 Tax=Psychrobacter sp. T6-6 TaxID=3457452 RepID=UPI003FD22591
MSNLPLQPLRWNSQNHARSAFHEYLIRKDGEARKNSKSQYEVVYGRLNTQQSYDVATGFATIEDAKTWCWNHYNEKMQPYVVPDSIADIANWFKAAKPEPTDEDLSVQIGCCLEEVCELLEGLGAQTGHYRELTDLANEFKYKGEWALKRVRNLTYQQRIDIVDACCDINVTSVGVMKLLGGVDVLGAQREVVRSNNSKMVDDKFIFDDNGKIMKPDSYSKPDLTPFVKQGE